MNYVKNSYYLINSYALMKKLVYKKLEIFFIKEKKRTKYEQKIKKEF